MKPTLCAAAASCLPFLGGCVFWDIRDEVRNTNSRLGVVESRLNSTNEALDTTNTKLESVTGQLKQVDHSLDRLDITNTSLGNVDERLVLLKSLDASLARVDTSLTTAQGSLSRLDSHLASLRKTIGRIDGMIPFLDLGTSGDPEPVAGDAPPAADPSVTPVPADGAAPAAEAAPRSTPRRDAILGVWISQYPDRSTVLVVQEGGRFVRQRAGQAGARPTVEAGTWKREGTRLQLVPDPPAAPPNPPAPVAAPAPVPSTSWDVMTQTVKTMALRAEAEGIMVFTKP